MANTATAQREVLRAIHTFPSLIKYLRDELNWPIPSADIYDFEDFTFDYTPNELGIDAANAAKIQEIKRLRPLTANQPWGIFFVKFEPKKLPVVVLRRILSSVVLKKRASATSAERPSWAADDLLFISNYGEGEARQISFAHFSEDREKSDLPTLKVLGWDDLDTPLHIDNVAEILSKLLRWPEDVSDLEQWRQQWQSAFTVKYGHVIRTSKDLAVRLAALARAVRIRINGVLAIETDEGQVRTLMKAFQTALIHDLDDDGFADMYAQTIAYGLLSARITNPTAQTADRLFEQVPITNPFLKELLETFLKVGGRQSEGVAGIGLDFDELGVSGVIDLLDASDMEAVLRDFGDRNPNEDPVIHFYELFLQEYDAKEKVKRGVFYTPRPVVSYIVRSIDEFLRSEFGLEDGLADTTTWGEMKERHLGLEVPDGVSPDLPFVQILDPATGTGTFLVEAIEVIYGTLVAKWKEQGHSDKEIDALWNDYVPLHCLPRVCGYELLMAPYAIAHVKIGLKLRETGYRFQSDARVRIYLTNALEPAQDFSGRFESMIPALAHEARDVRDIKVQRRFTTVIGNPPYSAASHNPSVDHDGKLTYIGTLMRRYFDIEGEALRERNPRWLQDDYVKFLRLAQSVIETSTVGVVGMITNHGYLANPTFRGMRYSILKTFDVARFWDLHGNSKRGERTLGGMADENVFDIQQGVAIALLSRSPAFKDCDHQVLHRDTYGTRQQKYDFQGSRGLEWTALAPSKPFFLFVPQNASLHSEFAQGTSIVDVFLSHSVGIVTARDELTIHLSKSETAATARLFTKLGSEDARRRFHLGVDSQDWRVSWAQNDLKGRKLDEASCNEITYRPFDFRFTYFTGRSRGFHCRPRGTHMRHMVVGPNLGLVTARSNKSPTPDHFYCSRFITEAKCGESTTQSCLFPLYLYAEENTLDLQEGMRTNLRPQFVENLLSAIKTSEGDSTALLEKVSPEKIFGYIYALFYSPSYRHRYAEFLKIDFPRVLMPNLLTLFEDLANLGARLVDLHTLRAPRLRDFVTTYTGPPNPEVGRVDWSEENVWLDTLASRKGNVASRGTMGFRGVPEAVWNFHIGGYQVCEKWLKDRKGRILSEDDIGHYQKIIIAIRETIRIMGEIDEVIEEHGGWPSAFAVTSS
jgi:predicted helicase